MNGDFSAFFEPGLDLFLNNASRCVLPKTHKKLLDTYISQWSVGKHDPYFYNFNKAKELRSHLGRFLSCQPDQISIQHNVAQAMSIIVNAINYTNKTEIIVIEDDYASILLPFQTLAHVTIIRCKRKNGKVDIQHLKSLFTAHTSWVVCSWVHYDSGQENNIKQISSLCQHHNCKLAVDATQALGVLPINLTEIQIDFFIASLYKWCFSLQSTAIAIFSKNLLSSLKPLSAGVFSQQQHSLTTPTLNTVTSASKFEYGNLNVLGIMLACESFKWFNTVGITAIHATYKRNVGQLMEICKQLNLSFGFYYDNNHNVPIITIKHLYPEDFIKNLQNMGGAATYRQGLIRFSVGLFHTPTSFSAFPNLFTV